MITIIKINKDVLRKDKLLVQLVGLSTDTKPTSLTNGFIANGSAFIELDTQDIYLFDEENSEWLIPSDEDAQDDNNDNNNDDNNDDNNDNNDNNPEDNPNEENPEENKSNDEMR